MTLFELEASLSLNTSEFDGAVKDAEGTGKSLAQQLGADAESIQKAFDGAFSISIGQLLADGFKMALGATWDFIEGSVAVAANAEETNNKIDAIFSEQANRVHQWAETTKEGYGIGATAAKQYAANIAGILSTDNLGLSPEEIFEMSTSLVELAGDLASFHNYDVDTTFQKILSGLRGETEAIQDLGIDIRASAVAAAYGMTDYGFGKLEPAEQLMMRYQYIMENTTIAQGDFARTSDSYSNQLKLFQQNISELQATLGEQLLPTLTGLLTIMNDLFASEESASDGIEQVKEAYAGSLASVESTATSALALVNALDELAASADAAGSREMWRAILSELEQTIPGIGKLINAETGKIEGGAKALREYIDNWKELSIESAKQRAMQNMLDEYSSIAESIFQLETEQHIADSMETEYARMMQAYESEYARIITAGMQAKGFDPETIDEYLRNSPDLGAAMTFGQILSGMESVDSVLAGSQLGFGQSSLYSLRSLWEAGGGMPEDLQAMVTGWATYNEGYEQYSSVQNDAAIAKLEAALATQEAELNAMRQYYDQIYSRFAQEDQKETNEQDDTAAKEMILAAQRLQAAAEKMASMSIVLDTGAIVGAVSSDIARSARSARYTAVTLAP